MSESALSRFRNVVPRGVQIAAATFAGAAILAACVWIFKQGAADAQAHRTSASGNLDPLFFAGFCVLAAFFLAAWLLVVGYVHGDAKRRGMQAGIWTLLVVLTPNLIGFLLYFALRKPLLAACGNCGTGINPDQRFCSSCGAEQNFSGTNPSGGASPVSPASAPNQQRSGISLKSFAVGFSVWTGIFLSKSLFAYLKHDTADSAALFGFAAIGMILLFFVHLKPATR